MSGVPGLPPNRGLRAGLCDAGAGCDKLLARAEESLPGFTGMSWGPAATRPAATSAALTGERAARITDVACAVFQGRLASPDASSIARAAVSASVLDFENPCATLCARTSSTERRSCSLRAAGPRAPWRPATTAAGALPAAPPCASVRIASSSTWSRTSTAVAAAGDGRKRSHHACRSLVAAARSRASAASIRNSSQPATRTRRTVARSGGGRESSDAGKPSGLRTRGKAAPSHSRSSGSSARKSRLETTQGRSLRPLQ
mmetsp:Transcript_21661/g.82433  ORF Transcript_21661/g.82433 Transcript_21661/m.82433 type:complete len:259 (-) Transcript_21661:96-872(-)